MAWGSISLFAGFLEKENSLETLIVIFEKVSPNMKFRNFCFDGKLSIFTDSRSQVSRLSFLWVSKTYYVMEMYTDQFLHLQRIPHFSANQD